MLVRAPGPGAGPEVQGLGPLRSPHLASWCLTCSSLGPSHPQVFSPHILVFRQVQLVTHAMSERGQCRQCSRFILSSSLSLPMTLEPELLQAVSAKVALSGWGKHWRSSDAPACEHRLSRRVTALDVFLTHDWEASAFLKFLTLLLVFNFRAACTASLLLSLFLVLLVCWVVSRTSRGRCPSATLPVS